MEIERKFLIDWEEINNLNLPLIKQAESWQGYLSAATPVVRIRKRDFTDGHTDYIPVSYTHLTLPTKRRV